MPPRAVLRLHGYRPWRRERGFRERSPSPPIALSCRERLLPKASRRQRQQWEDGLSLGQCEALSFVHLRYFLAFSFLGKKKEKVAKKKFNANESSIKIIYNFMWERYIHAGILLVTFLFSSFRGKKKVQESNQRAKRRKFLPVATRLRGI